MRIIRAGRLFFILIAVVALLLVTTSAVSHGATASCQIKVDGQVIVSDAAPEIINDRTFVPVATIVKYLGGTAGWNEKTQRVSLVYEDTMISLKIGSTTATVNNSSKKLDAAPYIVTVDANGGGRTMVPLRFISENFGFEVNWDGDSRTAIINTGSAEPTLAIKSTEIKTGQMNPDGGNTKCTIINVVGNGDIYAKAGKKGTMLKDPYRFYIDISDSKLANTISNKTCTASSSYVSSVRVGAQTGNVTRIVVDLKDSCSPTVTYLADHKTMMIVIPETYKGDNQESNQESNQGDKGNGGSENNQGEQGESGEGDSGPVTVENYDPYGDGKLVVCLDPGHSSITGGKRSPDNSLYEWEFNRSVAYKVKALLEAQGVQVIMTLGQNETEPTGYTNAELLQRRVDIANNAGNVDLFVSIHANANGSGSDWDSAYGWEVHIYSTNSVAELAAKSVEAATKNAISSIRDRGVKVSDFYVLKNTSMPAILVEHGFYTNEAECELLKSESYRNTLAQADATGIINFFAQFK